MCPTRRSPFFAKATTDGVVRNPSGVDTTVGSPSWMKAMHELVVPRSIPMTFDIIRLPGFETVAPHGSRQCVRSDRNARTARRAKSQGSKNGSLLLCNDDVRGTDDGSVEDVALRDDLCHVT